MTFSVAGVASGAMSKADEGAVADVIASADVLPVTQLTLTSTTKPARTYSVRVGSAVTVAVDTYRVEGLSMGGEVKGTFYGGAKLYAAPGSAVDEVVTVASEGGDYPLTAQHTHFALVLDRSRTSAYGLKGVRGDVEAVDDRCYHSVGDLSVTFVYAPLPLASPLTLVAYPVDDINYEPRTYSLGVAPEVAAGRWYSFSSAAVDVASGGFAVSTPAWGVGYNN